jgi:uncharacterized membrane protein YccC
MMPKLRKIGLLMMLLGIIIAIIFVIVYPFLHMINPHFDFDIQLFCIVVLPAIIVTGISWRWPYTGGFIAAVLSFIAVVYFLLSVINPSIEPRPDNFYIAITICYLLGSALLLRSFGILSLRKKKGKT